MKNLKIAAFDFWYKYRPYLSLIVLVAVAAVFRYTRLSELPGGLFPDEAANGLDINSILAGDHQPFYERGNGREALFFYMLTPAVMFLGRTPFAHHFVSAGLGVLVVALTFLLMRRWFNQRIAFIAAFLTAVSSWYVTLSRTAFRANSAPLFSLLFFYFATRVVQAKSRLDYWLSSIIAGISFSLGFYTYISYRMMVPLIGATFILLLIVDFRTDPRWQMVKKYWRAAVSSILAALITIFPLAHFFYTNPEWLIGRSGQVSIFSKDLNNGDVLGTFFDVLGRTILGFITDGDDNWRHNVSGFPFLSFLVAPFFVVGILLVVAQAALFVVNAFKKNEKLLYKINLKRLPYFILAFWFFLMLVPEVLTAEGIPHGLRLVGIIPVVFIIPALFIGEIISELPQQKSEKRTWQKIMVTLVLAVFLIAELFYGAFLYFGIAGNSPEYQAAFRSDLTVVSNYLNQRNNKSQTYLVLDEFWEQTPRYLTSGRNNPYQIIEPSSLWRGPAGVEITGRSEKGLNLESGDELVLTQSTINEVGAIKKFFPNLELKLIERDRWQEKAMVVYRMP